MILRNGNFSGKILRKIFRTGKFSMENFPPHITRYGLRSELKPQKEYGIRDVGCGKRPSVRPHLQNYSTDFDEIFYFVSRTVAVSVHIGRM
jgi:hypothetical protein